MKNLLSITIAIIISITTFAQDDAKAKSILDKLSAKTKSYSTIKADFSFTMLNKADGLNETQTGAIKVKGDKYVLSIKGQDVICNGKSIWTYIKDADEVQINDMPDEDEEDFISPSKIFTLYEDGFKYKFVKEVNGVQIINLYPKVADEKSFHRIELHINKAKNQISKAVVFGKDGTNSTYTFKNFTPNGSISDSEFSFDKTKHPKVEIIDLRD